MILFKTNAGLIEWLGDTSKKKGAVGFVPTMGALHRGHLDLIEHSKRNAALTVCSIFVNPTQFNDPQDFAKYPVTLEKDLRVLEEKGCDIVFLPSVKEMYPNGTAVLTHFDLGHLETVFEGAYRPGHFQGVCQVVHRLLEIVRPNILFLGQKDYQQCMVIKKLVALSGWEIDVSIIATVRETSGLALSSRNLRLSEKDKGSATAIYSALRYLKKNIQPGNLNKLLEKAAATISEAGFEKIDYVAIANADTLEPLSGWNGQTPLVALVAAFISGVRLIDNIRLD